MPVNGDLKSHKRKSPLDVDPSSDHHQSLGQEQSQHDNEPSDDDMQDKFDPVSRLDLDSHVVDTLDLRDSKHDSLINMHEGKVETTFGTRDKEYRKTYDAVFNDSTLRTIYRLFQRKVLLTVEYPISTGKEANVFLGLGMDNEPVAVKIFRESTSTFRKVRPYIEGDPRFNHVLKDRRGLVAIWAKKEFKNLKRLENAGVRVPKARGIDRNVLVMEYIGDDTMPAPTLRNWWHENRGGSDTPDLISEFYEEIKEQMKKVHQEAGLVHADLSEFNILISNDQPYIIDVGQAVLHAHPMSIEFFERDIKNITAFFRKIGVDATEKELRDFVRTVD